MRVVSQCGTALAVPISPMPSPNDLMNGAREKLMRALGAEEGRRILNEALRRSGLSSVDTAGDLLKVADQLMRRGGLLEAVARSLKIQAILAGASEPPPPSQVGDRPSAPPGV
ncbi:MAG: hypothetical protein H6718_21385 [Polyangiaceae bacterium]|nr:hypothetical protein [Myxococcales bacterium]MCB9587973.1 hypothetical protein [Polyangiaceae bacterium]